MGKRHADRSVCERCSYNTHVQWGEGIRVCVFVHVTGEILIRGSAVETSEGGMKGGSGWHVGIPFPVATLQRIGRIRACVSERS